MVSNPGTSPECRRRRGARRADFGDFHKPRPPPPRPLRFLIVLSRPLLASPPHYFRPLLASPHYFRPLLVVLIILHFSACAYTRSARLGG